MPGDFTFSVDIFLCRTLDYAAEKDLPSSLQCISASSCMSVCYFKPNNTHWFTWVTASITPVWVVRNQGPHHRHFLSRKSCLISALDNILERFWHYLALDYLSRHLWWGPSFLSSLVSGKEKYLRVQIVVDSWSLVFCRMQLIRVWCRKWKGGPIHKQCKTFLH